MEVVPDVINTLASLVLGSSTPTITLVTTNEEVSSQDGETVRYFGDKDDLES